MSLLTNVVNTINNTVSSSITEGSNFVNQLLATDMPPPPPPRTNPTQIMQIRALFADLIEAADPKHPHAANTIRSVLAKHIETITLLQQDFTLLKKAGIPLSQETANAIQQKFNMAGLFGIQINRSNIDRYLSNEEALRIAVDAQESVKNYDFSDVVFHLCNYFSSLFHSDTSELAQFFQKIVKNYYSSQLYEDRKTLMIHLLRETSPNTDDMTKISLLVHHSGPYFLKLLQTVVDKLKGSTDPKVVTFIRIMESVKSSLPPIPQEEVDLQMEKIRKESPFSVQILKSLGAATMGETFLLSCDDPCNATSFYAVMKLKRPNIKEKVQREEFIFEREAAGNPGMEKFIHSFKSTMAEDLDFRNEAKNVQKARSYFGSGRVGTVEFLDVMPVSDDYFFMELAPGHDLDHWLRHIDTMPSSERFAKLRLLTVLNKSVQSLVEKWIEVLLFSSHHEGLLHKDPHAGNIIIEIPFLTSPDKLEHGETYVRFIDWGSASFISASDRQELYNALVASSRWSNNPHAFIHSMEELCRHPYTDSEKKAIISLFGRLKEWSLGAVLHEMTLANIDIPEHFTQMVRAITHLENICNSINLKNDELSFNATPLSFETIAAECIKSHLLSLNNLAKRVSWWKDRDSSVTLPAREIFENL